MKSLQVAGLLFALALASTAYAATDAGAGRGLTLNDGKDAREQLDRVERSLGSEQYSEIALEDKSKVQAALNRIRLRLGDNETVDKANAQARTDIFNDQELVNTLLGRAQADSRMVCRRERTTGSNRTTQVCMTVAQRRQAMEKARDTMDKAQRGGPKLGGF